VPSRRRFLHHASSALLYVGAAVELRGQRTGVEVFYDASVLAHQPSPDHPESRTRLEAVMRSVRALEAQKRLTISSSTRMATDDDVLLVHSAEYLKKVRAEVSAGRRTLSTGDTEISSGSWTAALAAAGSTVAAVDAVMAGRTRSAFCAVRPPGHHASAARGMGFCVFNNVAIGARHARRRHGVERILIVDWDVHHGNGTQDLFWSDGSVLFFDTHQHPW
jgi:acetoin utilization deacetylase AcuC-like enzyme